MSTETKLVTRQQVMAAAKQINEETGSQLESSRDFYLFYMSLIAEIFERDLTGESVEVIRQGWRQLSSHQGLS